jgi:hypothetical protein
VAANQGGIMRTLFTLAIAATIAGCATQKELVATGGSRSDGVVELSFEYGGFEDPQLNAQQGLATATARCQAWGYPGAEPFGGERRQCQFSNEYGCMRWTVTIPYQCTGASPA